METGFVKLNGCGNDFVMIEDMDGSISLSPDQVQALCDRHFGIGADGVILVQPADDGAEAFMNYINSDGTFAEMCGNGVRCFAKFLVDEGLHAGDGPIVVQTRAGDRTIEFEVDGSGKLALATVDMGEPILDPVEIPVAAEPNARTLDGVYFGQDFLLDSPWGAMAFTFVSMGNPHAVCFLDDIDALPDELFEEGEDKSLESLRIDLVGSYYEQHQVFPERANIEFAVIEDDGIHMRVYERGCGETLACGTGACATSVAATLTERADRKNDVILRGGTLSIDWTEEGTVLMTGPAAESFRGTVDIR